MFARRAWLSRIASLDRGFFGALCTFGESYGPANSVPGTRPRVVDGVSPKAAQSLARHSTIDLTMNVYTSLTVNDQASALAFLPPIPALMGKKTSALRATGTDG